MMYHRHVKYAVLLLLLVGCGSSDAGDPLDGGAGDGGSSDARAGDDGALADAALRDDDRDGLDDARELALARDYLPFLALSPTDGCKVGGLLARVRPHPMSARCVLITYVHLFDKDCGIGGHDGDNEAFGVTVDPALPAPQGIRAVKAISHQGTLCERQSSCGDVGGLTACQTLMKGAVAWPALWSSRNKHGGYVNRTSSCTTFATCIDTCEDNTTAQAREIVNVGEPAQHLVSNLSTQGFITAANGWTSAGLMNYDPWGGQDFGGAGKVSEDLVDPAFVTPGCP